MIVLIDDSLSNQKILHRMLSRITDDKVHLFTNGPDAKSFIETNKASITFVIIDGNLAKPYLGNKIVNGPDVAKDIIAIDSKIPLVPWTDDKMMLQRFTDLFHAHSKPYFILKKPAGYVDLVEMLEFTSALLEKQKKEAIDSQCSTHLMVS